MSTHVNVVGGGLAGLVAATELADLGFGVTLLERRPQLGGLATTTSDPYRANVGPHALYTNNPLHGWLRSRGLLPRLVKPGARDLSMLGFVESGKVKRPVQVLPSIASRLRAEAPADPSYREWATSRFGTRTAERLIGLASLPLFHHDPGELSARSVQRALRNAFLDGTVTYVQGGWGRLTDVLAETAVAAGVEICLDAPVTSLPEPPVILAIPMPAAAQLLGDPSLDWPSSPTALLDAACDVAPDGPPPSVSTPTSTPPATPAGTPASRPTATTSSRPRPGSDPVSDSTPRSPASKPTSTSRSPGGAASRPGDTGRS